MAVLSDDLHVDSLQLSSSNISLKSAGNASNLKIAPSTVPSWDDWVNSMMLAGLNAVAIAGLTTCHLWAFTKDFSLDLFELRAISNHLLTGSQEDPPKRLRLGHADVWECERFYPSRLLVATYSSLAIVVVPTNHALLVARVFRSHELTTDDAVRIVQNYAEEIKKHGI